MLEALAVFLQAPLSALARYLIDDNISRTAGTTAAHQPGLPLGPAAVPQRRIILNFLDGSFPLVLKVFMVVAAETLAVFPAVYLGGEALAVEFQALGFLAVAFFFDGSAAVGGEEGVHRGKDITVGRPRGGRLVEHGT